MSADTAQLAASRYGLGARPGELANLTTDPKGWLLAQISRTPSVPAPLSGLDSTASRLGAVLGARENGNEAVQQILRGQGRQWQMDDLRARTQAATETPTPFVERLVHFWSNHFTVSTTKPVLGVAAVGYETEAIRPHVLGRFSDMLKAAVGHPAMLIYLDNAQSVGPDSRVGIRRERGLNENLAREILELHTLGVDGGYGQDDVRALAEILTGWSIARGADPGSGAFLFRPNIHQPGDKTLLGLPIRENGQNEALDALEMLARHPSTANHVATKLVRHFVADDPPAAMVHDLAQRFISSSGDLAAVAEKLIGFIDWVEDPLGKLKSPHDLVISTLRAFDAAAYADGGVTSMRLMGQLPFTAPSPAGWPDRTLDWLGPDALMKRIDWAAEAGRRLASLSNPVAIGHGTIWPIASAETRFEVESAPNAAEGIALLIASPEFQRR